MTRSTQGLLVAVAGLVVRIVARYTDEATAQLVGEVVMAAGTAWLAHGLIRRVPRGEYARSEYPTTRSR